MRNNAFLRMVLSRLGSAVPSMLSVIVVTFVLTRALPGDPAAYFAGPAATPQAVEEIRVSLGLNRPLTEQFVSYLVDLTKGDLGTSLTTGQPVLADIGSRLPASLELTLTGLTLAIVVGIPLGITAATGQGRWVDHLCRVLGTAGVCLPVFFTGLLLSYLFYYLLGLAPPPLGRLDAFDSPPARVTGFYLVDSALMGDMRLLWSSLKHLILPSATLGIFALAPISRMTRAAMLGALSSDYVRTARAYGLGTTKVLYVYALRNAFLPILTTMGMVFSFLLGANVLVEKVFAWPGIGSYAIESLIASDYAPVQGFILTMAVLYVLLNLFIDFLYGLIDPRARSGA